MKFIQTKLLNRFGVNLRRFTGIIFAFSMRRNFVDLI